MGERLSLLSQILLHFLIYSGMGCGGSSLEIQPLGYCPVLGHTSARGWFLLLFGTFDSFHTVRLPYGSSE